MELKFKVSCLLACGLEEHLLTTCVISLYKPYKAAGRKLGSQLALLVLYSCSRLIHVITCYYLLLLPVLLPEGLHTHPNELNYSFLIYYLP